MSERIYKVTVVRHEKNEEYLVQALSPKGARMHVAEKFITAKLAGGAEVARLMSAGKRVENAINPDPEPTDSSLETPAP